MNWLAVKTARGAGTRVIAEIPLDPASKNAGPSGLTPVRTRDTDVEVFGPDLSIEVIDSDDEAVSIINSSPYGFVNAVFTASRERPSTRPVYASAFPYNASRRPQAFSACASL